MSLERCALDVRRSGDRLEDRAEQRLEIGGVRQSAVLGHPQAGAAGLGRGEDDGKVQRILTVGFVEQVHEEFVGLVDDLRDPRVRAVDLVDDQHDRHVGVERLAQHEPGLGQRTFRRVDQQHDPVDHGESALDLAAEVGVAGGVDDVHGDRSAGDVDGRLAGVPHGGVLREDRDALLALEVAGVHDPLRDALGLVGGERPRLVEHRVDQGRLAVVDVRHDRDVAQVFAGDAAQVRVGCVVRQDETLLSVVGGPRMRRRGSHAER